MLGVRVHNYETQACGEVTLCRELYSQRPRPLEIPSALLRTTGNLFVYGSVPGVSFS